MMKTTILAVILAASTLDATAEPFQSGQPLLPSAGKGVRVPAAKHTPSSARNPAPTNAKPAAAKQGTAQAQTLVRQHVETYYTKTYVPGSAGTRVVRATATVGATSAVPGWPNQLRTSGTVALVVVYKGKEQAETRSFDAVIEGGKITDFTAR